MIKERGCYWVLNPPFYERENIFLEYLIIFLKGFLRERKGFKLLYVVSCWYCGRG